MKKQLEQLRDRYKLMAADPAALESIMSTHNLDGASVWPWLLNQLLADIDKVLKGEKV